MSNEENEITAESVEEELLRQHAEEDEKLRTIGLFGEVNSTKAEEIIYGLYALDDTKTKKRPVDYLDLAKGLTEEVEPVEFIVSTEGGDATDMFAIYDAIRYLRTGMEIETFGLGKVMSAGVLLLASGTKGTRKIGKILSSDAARRGFRLRREYLQPKDRNGRNKENDKKCILTLWHRKQT